MTYEPSFFADGAPVGGFPRQPTDGPDSRAASAAQRPTVTRRQLRFLVEGPRGRSTRAAVFTRYISYILAIVLCSLITQAAFIEAGSAWPGGEFMLASAVTMYVTAAIGTLMAPTQRNAIIEQLRHFVFGISVFPATGIALFMWASRSLVASSAVTGNSFTGLLGTPLAVVFLCTTVIPAAVFIKAVAGMRTLARTQFDDEEVMKLYARQDQLQR